MDIFLYAVAFLFVLCVVSIVCVFVGIYCGKLLIHIISGDGSYHERQ